MDTLLAIDASPRSETSISRKLTSLFKETWQAAHPTARIIDRDLLKTDLPYVDLAWIGGAYAPPETHSAESAAAIRISNELAEEILSADEIVIGSPIYNFSIPARLKAYIDHVVRVGLTVSIDKVGLLKARKATIILASGGDFSPGSPFERYNLASGYLRQVLGFMGVREIEIILAGAPQAGRQAETAIEAFGEPVKLAAAA